MCLPRTAPLALLASLMIVSAGVLARQEPDPEPPTPGMGKLARYFPDDTHAVGVVNLKRLVASRVGKKYLLKTTIET